MENKKTLVVVGKGTAENQQLVRKIRNKGVYSEIWGVNKSLKSHGLVLGFIVTDPTIIIDTTKPVLKVHQLIDDDSLDAFLFDVCQAKKTWTIKQYIEDETQRIKSIVKENQVICGLSGGVDSSVVAALLQRAIGKQLVCIFVDHGLMRKDEGLQVKQMFQDHFGMNLVYVDASERFLRKLQNIIDPEVKRKIIGEEFVRVFEAETEKLTNAKFLAQGTIYSDILESGSDSSDLVKSHHNVGGLPEDINLLLIEPLKTLFKDEVRELGLELGLPKEMVFRQPFPGPGLGIRIIGEITKGKVSIVQEADFILRDEIAKANLQNDIWQYFTVLTNNRSVGVRDGQRSYEYALAIRAVHSIDGMSADFAHIPYDVLAKISHRLLQEITGINRIVYDITTKPPGTIEWE